MSSKKEKTFSIKVTVLFVFLVVASLTAGLTLGLQYYSSRDLAQTAAEQSFRNISEKVGDRIQYLDRQSMNLVNVLGHFSELRAFPDATRERLSLPLLTGAMEQNPSLYAIYVGYSNGEFFEIINLESSDFVRAALGAAAHDRWVLIKIMNEGGTRIKKLIYLNHHFEIRASRREDTTYDPRNRPWYIDANKKPGIIKTAPYIFSNLQSPGVTYAKAMDSGYRVVGVDISLAGLSDYFKSQRLMPGSEAFLFDDKGNVNAQTKQDEVNRVGGRLAPPVLPHHRAYGSVPRRFM